MSSGLYQASMCQRRKHGQHLILNRSLAASFSQRPSWLLGLEGNSYMPLCAGVGMSHHSFSSCGDLLPELWHPSAGRANHQLGCWEQRQLGRGLTQYHDDQKGARELPARHHHTRRTVRKEVMVRHASVTCHEFKSFSLSHSDSHAPAYAMWHVSQDVTGAEPGMFPGGLTVLVSLLTVHSGLLTWLEPGSTLITCGASPRTKINTVI